MQGHDGVASHSWLVISSCVLAIEHAMRAIVPPDQRSHWFR